MSRSMIRLFTMATAVTLLAFAPLASAQDMTGAAQTDPPAPVADGFATITGTYVNLGPGNAVDVNVDVLFPIQPQTWPPDSEGFDALFQSAVGTDTNGNEPFWGFDTESMCNYYRFELQQPNDTGDQPMTPNPFPAGTSGSFTWQMPVIPMEGLNASRVIITEPEDLRASYSVNSANWTNFPWLTTYAGLYNLAGAGAMCDNSDDAGNPTIENCEDLDSCIGARLWQVEPFEAELVLADDGGGTTTEGDPLFACGELVNADEVAGKIAVVRRGGTKPPAVGCTFVEKIENAQAAGALGLIMANHPTGTGQICGSATDFDPDECALPMGGAQNSGYFVDIPAVMLSRRQGEALITALENGQTVRAKMGNVPADHVDIFTWIFTDEDPPFGENDYRVDRVPLAMPEEPTDVLSFFAAAAVAAGAEGAFFQTDIEINNKGGEDATVTFLWLPRGQDNSAPTASDPVTIGPGESIQYPNALNSIFGLEPNSVGAVAMLADSSDVIGMSRTYNNPADVEGTFGQALPAVPYSELIMTGETQRIIFMSENDDFRANLGCVNGTNMDMTVDIMLYDAAGDLQETVPMALPPWSNKQLNQIFEDYAPVNGYADVSTATADAAFYCYGSVLDNATSDPTTVLPQVPSDDMIFIAAAAVAGGAQGAFFQTDADLNNSGSESVTYSFLWLPRGQDNSAPTASEEFTLGAGMGVRIQNVLSEIFGAQPNALGALAITASSADLLAMTRTYNLLGEGNELGYPAGSTFGQALPGVHMDKMIPTGEKKRIIFMNENENFRANLGCVNAVNSEIVVNIDMFGSDGTALETKFMVLPPWSNKQINQIFDDYAPVNGYVDVWTDTPDASFLCYGSVLDNVTSDPTTVLPQ